MSSPTSTSSSDERALLGEEGTDTLLDRVDGFAAPDDPSAATQAGFRQLGVALAVLFALAAIPYASEALDFARAWVPGEGVPIVRMFRPDAPSGSGMAVATGGAATGATGPGPGRLAEQLGGAVAANLEEDDPEEPRPVHEVEEPGARAPAVRVEPRELEGLVREIEDPSGAMTPFYEALLQTAARAPGAITRVAHYGDSSIAGDGITVTVRRRMQQRFGDAGHGFILVARGNMPYRHQDVRHTSSGAWQTSELVRAGLRDRRYGYGGVLLRSPGGGRATFQTSDRGPVGGAVSRFLLYYQEHPRGGRLELRVDDGEREVLSTRGETLADRVHRVEVEDGEHRLELRALGGGEVRLYGVALEREGPGVVYDSLGMVGARARRMLGYDPEHFREQHEQRGTHLIVLAFGGNDADDPRTPEQFERDFREVIRMVKSARPRAACLLMAPLDQAHRDARGVIETMPQVPVIVAAQRRAAMAEGCAFFDTFEAMGGEGAMRAWFRSQPRLAFGDFRHATPAGYRVIGNMLYKALLKGFADHLER